MDGNGLCATINPGAVVVYDVPGPRLALLQLLQLPGADAAEVHRNCQLRAPRPRSALLHLAREHGLLRCLCRAPRDRAGAESRDAAELGGEGAGGVSDLLLCT